MRRHGTKPPCMVRRRSTVRFRNGAPGQRGFSNIGFQDQVTNKVMRLQLTAGAARRIQTPAPLWCAVIGLDSTASDLWSLGTAGYARIRPLPVSVAWSRAPSQSIPTIAESAATRCHGLRRTHESRGTTDSERLIAVLNARVATRRSSVCGRLGLPADPRCSRCRGRSRRGRPGLGHGARARGPAGAGGEVPGDVRRQM
jgi:hypothetical protein